MRVTRAERQLGGWAGFDFRLSSLVQKTGEIRGRDPGDQLGDTQAASGEVAASAGQCGSVNTEGKSVRQGGWRCRGFWSGAMDLLGHSPAYARSGGRGERR